MKKIALKILFTLFIVISAFSGMIISAAEEIDTEQENKTKTVIKFTDYKELKGVELIKMVQLVLKDSGFDPGPIDGVFGPKKLVQPLNNSKNKIILNQQEN